MLVFLICCCSHVNIFLPFTFSERMARHLPPVPSAPCPQHETDVLPVALVALGGAQCCVRPSENWLLGAYRCWWSLGLSENPRASVCPALHLLRRLLVRGPTKATPTEAWPARASQGLPSLPRERLFGRSRFLGGLHV